MSDNITLKREDPYLPVKTCLFTVAALKRKGQRNSSSHALLVPNTAREERLNVQTVVVQQMDHNRCSSITMRFK